MSGRGERTRPRPEDVAAQGPRRLHPSSLVFHLGRLGRALLLPGLLVVFFAVGDEEDAWFMWAFVPVFLYSVLRYFTMRYELTPTELVVREGVLFRSTRHIPYGRIQNVDTAQNPLHRLLRVAEVRIETAAGTEPEAILQVVSAREVDEIRRGIFAGRTGRAAPAAPEGEAAASERAGEAEDLGRPVFRLGGGDVLLFGLLSQRGLAYLAGGFFLAWEFDVFERLEQRFQLDAEEALVGFVESFEGPSPLVWGALVLALAVLLQVLTTVWAFVTLHGFRLVLQGEDLRSTCGLWTHQTATLPRRRIQRLALREGWLLRRLGRGSLRVTTAGADSTEGRQISRRWLVPVARRPTLLAVAGMVLPEVDFEPESWRPVHPRAWRRLWTRLLLAGAAVNAVLATNAGPEAFFAFPAWVFLALLLARARARRLGWYVGREVLVVRDGWLAIERTGVRFSKIQAVTLTRSPFDRRHGMATVRVSTAGGSAGARGVVVPFLPLREARRLSRRLAREAAAVEFRW